MTKTRLLHASLDNKGERKMSSFSWERWLIFVICWFSFTLTNNLPGRRCFFYKESFLQEMTKTRLLHALLDNKCERKISSFSRERRLFFRQLLLISVFVDWWRCSSFQVDGSERWQTLCLPLPSNDHLKQNEVISLTRTEIFKQHTFSQNDTMV